ncbi:MAG: hypothetical protein JXX14_00205 [Deltaproteobacteria bacterium]|nr:hypothetical protein [Deltaproteobacteria bacterium]
MTTVDGFGANIRIDGQFNIAFVSVSGTLGVGGLPVLLKELLQTRGFKRSMNSVVDLRNARLGNDISSLPRLSELYLSSQIERGHSFRTAFVCNDDFTFGICRMVAVELEQVPIWVKVVRNMDDALAWVGGDQEWISEADMG